ncbi:HAD family hydrolase [Corynebacterium yudongzhengii]|uniref:HAD family hydrolase n=1 Tax=Corynebacterium yudongzhengii TaxID=2080740 RepID=A0A2U1T7Q9_9CORY|nr:HAD-IA family hydrolase [Corynebacterium yudongzhengii]AWB81501.1 HAD family hydrolase [Corynebacterium yudongzhengii]PWC01928.1 HAD family hydrolase [Corynebacterium yudongzhengii]
MTTGRALPADPRRILFFDVDGTLVDSYPGIRAGFLAALDSVGCPHPDEQFLRHLPGPPLEHNLAKLIDDPADVDRAFRTYMDYTASGGVLEATAFDGMVELLQRLRAEGFYLSTATSKGTDNARTVLRALGFWDSLDFLAAAEEYGGHRRSKVAVIDYALDSLGLYKRRDDILMIGDRHHDIDGARQQGLTVCAVTWGYGTAEEALEADYTAHTPTELEEIIHDWAL